MPNFAPQMPQDCPPNDAVPAAGTVYSCARQHPFSDNEFRTAHERNWKPEADECLRCGLSVCTDIRDAREIKKRFRRVFKYIGVAALNAAHGVIKKTPGQVASHHTLWRFETVEFHLIFQLQE